MNVSTCSPSLGFRVRTLAGHRLELSLTRLFASANQIGDVIVDAGATCNYLLLFAISEAAQGCRLPPPAV